MADTTKPNPDAAGGDRASGSSGMGLPESTLGTPVEVLLERELDGQEEERTPTGSRKSGGKEATRKKGKAEEEIDDIDDEAAMLARAMESEDQHNADDDDVEDSDDDEPDAEEEEDTETEAETDEETESSDEADDDDDDGSKADSLEELPKSWQKHIKKLRSEAKGLRDRLKEASARDVPTPESPFADVLTTADLDKAVDYANRVHELFGNLTEDDYTEAANGSQVYVLKSGGKEYLYTKDQIEQELAFTAPRRDVKAVRERERWLAEREKADPVEQAEALAPGIVTDSGSEAGKWLAEQLRKAPGLRALPDFEVVLARAWRDLEREARTKPTKTHPKGRGKWVYFDLDEQGRVLPPKRKAGPESTRAKERAPSSPNGSRPAARPQRPGAGKGREAMDRVLKTKTSLSSNEDIAAMLDAELNAA